MANKGEGRNLLGQSGTEAHLRGSGLQKRNAIRIFHRRNLPQERAQIRTDDLNSIPRCKFIAQAENCIPPRVACLDNGADLPLAQIAGVLCKLAGVAVVKSGGVMAVRNMFNLIAPDFVRRMALPYVVKHMAIGPSDDGRVIGRFCASLNLQAVNPGIAKFIQMIDHAHITGVHDVCALFILEDREKFSGAFFLHQGILIPARLGTLTTIGIAASHIIAEQTATGIGYAHGSVTERLKFQFRRDTLPDVNDLLKAQFARKHDATGPKIEPALRAGIVCDRLLR